MNNLSVLNRRLCELQGRLFELSLEKGYNSEYFIEKFMNSETAKRLDDKYDRLQWAGENYILEELEDEVTLIKDNNSYSKEVMFWTGYTYRYWHYYKKETSKNIYKIANANTMKECYLAFHTKDVMMAIDDLYEISGKM